MPAINDAVPPTRSHTAQRVAAARCVVPRRAAPHRKRGRSSRCCDGGRAGEGPPPWPRPPSPLLREGWRSPAPLPGTEDVKSVSGSREQSQESLQRCCIEASRILSELRWDRARCPNPHLQTSIDLRWPNGIASHRMSTFDQFSLCPKWWFWIQPILQDLPTVIIQNITFWDTPLFRI